MYRQRVTAGFGPRLTPFVRNIIVALVVIYVVQIVLQGWLGLPISDLLALWAPMTPGGPTGLFHIWQPATALLINGLPEHALMDWVMLWFFLQPTLDYLGRKGTAKLLGTTWLVGVVVAFGLAWTGIIFNTPCVGVTALGSAMVIAYGMAKPDAEILLMFVLPIKGRWFVWFALFTGALAFLYYRSLEPAVVLAGDLAAVVWMWSDGSARQLWLKLKLKWLQRQRSGSPRRRGRFEVIDGGRSQSGNDDWVH